MRDIPGHALSAFLAPSVETAAKARQMVNEL
jgi:hypothetical protein